MKHSARRINLNLNVYLKCDDLSFSPNHASSRCITLCYSRTTPIMSRDALRYIAYEFTCHSRLYWRITLNNKNWNANVHFTLHAIRVALHYVRVAFASHFLLRRHYVDIPPRTEFVPSVGLRRGCITRWRWLCSRYTVVNSRSYQLPI